MKTRDGMIVSSGPYEFEWNEDANEDGRYGWWECTRCEKTGVGDTFTGDHSCWFEDRGKLASLLDWMIQDGWDTDELVRAVEKPWSYNEQAAEAGIR